MKHLKLVAETEIFGAKLIIRFMYLFLKISKWSASVWTGRATSGTNTFVNI